MITSKTSTLLEGGKKKKKIFITQLFHTVSCWLLGLQYSHRSTASITGRENKVLTKASRADGHSINLIEPGNKTQSCSLIASCFPLPVCLPTRGSAGRQRPQSEGKSRSKPPRLIAATRAELHRHASVSYTKGQAGDREEVVVLPMTGGRGSNWVWV